MSNRSTLCRSLNRGGVNLPYASEQGPPNLETPFESIHHQGSSVTFRDGECTSEPLAPALSNLSPADAARLEVSPFEPRSVLVEVQREETEDARHNLGLVLEEARAALAAGEPDKLIHFKLWLDEPEFDFRTLRTAKGPDRERILADRRALLASSQDELEQVVRAVGGDVEARRMLTNGLVVNVPAREVESVLNHRLVHAAYLSATGYLEAAGDGIDRMNALSQVGPPTHTGATGGNLGGVVWIGQIEAPEPGGNNLLNTSALAFRDSIGNSRTWHNRVCGASSCVSGGTGTLSTHATWVASVMAGDLRAGQDANYPGADTTAQKRRSGLARGSEIAFFRMSSDVSDHLETSIENAVAFGVDIINMSLGLGNCSELCNRNYNPSGINADLYAASDAGIVIVKSAGNEHGACGPSQTCDVIYPGGHPDVIAVSALADNDFNGSTDPWQDNFITSLSSRGYRNHTALDGQTAEVPTIGLSTFGTVRWVTGENPSHYVTLTPLGDTISGTSVAAPQVSSLAALFRQWFRGHSPGTASDPWNVQVKLLAMGDAKCGSDCIQRTKINDAYGFGFPRYFVPTWSYLQNGGWGTRVDVITQGGAKAWDVGGPGPEANNVNGFKLVVALDTTLATPPALLVHVVDTCPTGPVGFIRTAVRQGTRYRIVIDNPNDIRGKCLRVAINGLNVKSGGEVFYATDFYWSTTNAYHIED